jgi:hypothetical protein
MAVHVTDKDSVALFDSVTGIAFGEVFSDHDHAIAFLDYLHSIEEDARALSPADLERIRRGWERDRP